MKSKIPLLIASAIATAAFFFLFTKKDRTAFPHVRNGDRGENRVPEYMHSSDYASNYTDFKHSWNGNDITKIGRNAKGVTYWLNGKKVFAPYGANGRPDFSRITPVSKLV